MNNFSKKLRLRILKNNWMKVLLTITTVLVALSIFGIFGFIISETIPGFAEYGFTDIFFKASFEADQVGIAGALLTSLVTTFISVLIAAVIGTKFAFFVTEKSGRFRNFFNRFIQLLSGVPSIIFGLFALYGIGSIIKDLFGWDSNSSMFGAIIMLIFMILPNFTSIIINAVYELDPELRTNSIAMGTSRSYTTYKVLKLACSKQIRSALIISTCRAIGETMALSIVLTAPATIPFSDGFVNFFKGSQVTLSALIANQLFSDSGSAAQRSVLYIAGATLFIIVFILNYFANRSLYKKNNSQNIFARKIHAIVFSTRLRFAKARFAMFQSFAIKKNDRNSPNAKVVSFHKMYTIYKNGWEFLAVLIALAFLVWIILFISIQGISAWVQLSNPNHYLPNEISNLPTGYDQLSWTILTTVLLISLSLVFAYPVALGIAIYFWKNPANKVTKSLRFLIDSIGATPSILLGLFGQTFFLSTLHLANNQTGSILAGSLTVFIVILPSYVRMIETGFENVSIFRINSSAALGLTDWESVTRILLPSSKPTTRSATISAIGRILSETAPVWLTMGLLLPIHSGISLFSPAQTLTTRILFGLQYSSDGTVGKLIAYQAAFVNLFLVAVIVFWTEITTPFIDSFRKIFKIIKDKKRSLLIKKGERF